MYVFKRKRYRRTYVPFLPTSGYTSIIDYRRNLQKTSRKADLCDPLLKIDKGLYWIRTR